MPEHVAPLAVVTGASSGIGAAVARRLAKRGYRTVLMAQREALLERLAQDLSASAPSAAVRVDLSDASAIDSTIQTVLREHGPVDVLVNNAGFGFYGPFLEYSGEQHRLLMQVNYFAALALTRAVLPGMLQQRRGHVINVSSMCTKMGPYGHSGYAAAKSALVSLTQCLASDYAEDGVRFSYVNPGIVDTEYFDASCFAPLRGRIDRRRVAADDVAERMVRLLDRPQLELCVPRYYRLLDLIKAISPTWAHRLVRNSSRPKPKVEPAPAVQQFGK